MQKMNDGQTRATKNDLNDCTLSSMFHDFYNRKMIPVVIFIWVWAMVFIAGVVYSGAEFLKAEETKQQIMYAAIFIFFMQCVAMMKIFAWQMIHRNAVIRQIKRLELRITELANSLTEGYKRA
jgi:hypothetical protein